MAILSRGHTTWRPDNLPVGRGAVTNHRQHLSAASTPRQTLPLRHDGLHNAPTSHNPPTLQSHQDPSEKPPPFPLDTSPPKLEAAHEATHEAAHEASQEFEQIAEDSLAEQENSEPPTPELIAHALDMEVKLSYRVHVVGFTQHAKLLSHSLSALPHIPPVRMMALFPRPVSEWGEEGRTLTVHNPDGSFVSHEIPCPQYIDPTKVHLAAYTESDDKEQWLDNIVICTAPWAVSPFLKSLKHRIDRHTNLCLLQPGLGWAEMLNEFVFQDESLRPNYIYAHTTHRVDKHPRGLFSLKHVKQGKLVLCDVYQNVEPTAFETRPINSPYTDHLVNLLGESDALGAVGLPWEQFLFNKLPSMVWTSLADTISVILGTRFDLIVRDRHAMMLWDSLLEETVEIITSLPELQGASNKFKLFRSPTFRNRLKTKLFAQGRTYSPWISWVRLGKCPPVEYTNGWFVKRAQQLGIYHKQNSMAISMVQARLMARRKELRMDIPFAVNPYMTDGDKLGGSQYYEDEDVNDKEELFDLGF
ncbi:hypothetical protein F4778DRAFT_794534 [Xylariomycetidae sp. FL2044]|nr:hypothetical protein F4778DRAFT_794534 [Xylariomycetidae sp. FL2044]